MTAKDYLKQVEKIETLMRNKTSELKKAEGIGISQTIIQAEIQELYKKRKSIIETIEQLPEAEYDVLYKIYVQGATLYEVASDRAISYSLATTLHGRALKHLDEIINAT